MEAGQFLSNLDTMLTHIHDVMKIYDSKVAFEFNPINFLRPDENKHSEILAYFLDPKKKHGQGSLFLDLFLKHIDLKHLIGEPVKVTCEKRIDDQRRIDILLSFEKTNFGLAIENKIGALDQKDQVSDYMNYLQRNYSDNYCMIYLNPDGNNPSEESIKADKRDKAIIENTLKIISYKTDIINCLHEWGQYCQADKVRSFINDFEQYIKHNLMGERFMSEQNIIVKQILEKPANIEMAFSISNSLNQVKQELIPKLEDTIIKVAEKKKDMILGTVFNVDISKLYTGFRFSLKDWEDLKIGFNFEKAGLNNLIYGLIGKTKNNKELAAAIKNRFGGKTSEAWPFYKEMNHPYNNWGNLAAPWIGLYNGELEKIIESIIDDILTKLDEPEFKLFKDNIDSTP